MNVYAVRVCILFTALTAILSAPARSQPSPKLILLDMGAGVEGRLHPNADNVSVSSTGTGASRVALISIAPGKEGYPGVNIHPPTDHWDLSSFGHIEAKVTNTGSKPLTIALRVDNAGDWQNNPWNTESVTLDPGKSDTVKTMFGYSYGLKKGFKLNPATVVNVMLFTLKSDWAQSFKIESVIANGPAHETPPIAPDDVRTKPVNGAIFGGSATFDAATQVQDNGANSILTSVGNRKALTIDFRSASATKSVTIKPAVGRWDLTAASCVEVALGNNGGKPVHAKARLLTNGGPSDWATVTLSAGSQKTLTAFFAGTKPYVVGKPDTGSKVTSDAVSGIEIGVDPADESPIVTVDSIKAVTRVDPNIPAWLGKRPPVPGAWVKTLDDEFDRSRLDESIWNPYGENYYDKVTHWAQSDVILGGGVVKLRYEKKSGYQNDDIKRNRTDYAAGYLTTYERWAQRYGYFEARMKLPKAPGLWPAFWMMPDRGVKSNPQWQRQDTANGGMEFDIMENLSRWGTNRYNIAMHYDGYAAQHKSVGSDKIYVEPDTDGYITCGLLWLPGTAVFYCNGHEVLRWESPRICNVPSCFLFTVPAGGWDNNEVDDSRLPSDFVIQYVRVWQRKDLASPLDGKESK